MKKKTVSTFVQAATAGALLASATSATAAPGEWEFSLAPMYLWGLSIEGDSTINGNTAPLDLGFKDDVFENLEAVLTFHFEARRDDWTVFAEYNYLNLTPDGDISQGPVTAELEIDFDAVVAELGAAWAFSETQSTRWELVGGGRYIDQEIEVDINIDLPAPLPPKGNTVEWGDDWAHAFGGVRVIHKMTERWSMSARADYGYGGSDNDAINLNLLFDYRFRDWGSAFVGFRYQEYDYSSSSYAYDAKQQGPLAGIFFHW